MKFRPYAFVLCVLFARLLAAQSGADLLVRTEITPASDQPVAATVALVYLKDDAPPLNEMLQADWHALIRPLLGADSEPPKPDPLMAGMAADGGVVMQTDAHGVARFSEVMRERRIAVAVQFEKVWWPLEREVWLEPTEQAKEVTVPVVHVSGDLGLLEALSCQIMLNLRNPQEAVTSGTAHLVVQRMLMLRNVSEEFAVQLEGDTILAEFGMCRDDALEDSGFWYLASTSEDGTGHAAEGDAAAAASLVSSLDPYVPWSRGKGWVADQHTYAARGPKFSPYRLHPARSERDVTCLGAGTITVDPGDKGTPPRMAFRKVILPGQTVMLSMRETPSLAGDGTVRVSVPRSPLPVQELMFHLHPGLAIAPNRPGLNVSEPQPSMRGLQSFSLIPDGEEPALAAYDSLAFTVGLDRAALTKSASVTTRRAPLAKLLWAISGFFGLVFVTMMVRNLRGTRETQLRRMHRTLPDRHQALAELARLDGEAAAGRLPQEVYRQDRERILASLLAMGEALSVAEAKDEDVAASGNTQ